MFRCGNLSCYPGNVCLTAKEVDPDDEVWQMFGILFWHLRSSPYRISNIWSWRMLSSNLAARLNSCNSNYISMASLRAIWNLGCTSWWGLERVNTPLYKTLPSPPSTLTIRCQREKPWASRHDTFLAQGNIQSCDPPPPFHPTCTLKWFCPDSDWPPRWQPCLH